MTDAKGSPVSLHDYQPFGEEIAGGVGGRCSLLYGQTDNPRQKFTGKERDSELANSADPFGLDYFGARYFSAAQGRFTSPDWSATPQPIPYADLTDPQTLNLYSYVRNNPLSKADPDGHCGLFGTGQICTSVGDFLSSLPNRVVGGLKGEANAALELFGVAPRFQASHAEQADAMAQVELVKPEFQQGLAMAIPGPKGEAVEAEALSTRAQEIQGTLSPRTQRSVTTAVGTAVNPDGSTSIL